MKREAATPREYLASLSGVQLELVQTIRGVIRQLKPQVEERVRYGMLDYPELANLAAQKHYVSLYAASEVLARHRDRFPGIDAGKSCLRFKKLDQLDVAALVELFEDVRAFRDPNAKSEKK